MAVDNRTRSVMEIPTAGYTVPAPASPPPTAGDLIPRVSALRYTTDAVNSSAARLSRDVYTLNLDERTAGRAHQSVKSLLTDLTTLGLSWSMISRSVGVSIPAIRKWRQGEGATPSNRQTLAKLLALLDMLNDQFMIEDPASWLEIPLGKSQRTLIDAFVAGRVDLILEYAANWISSPDTLFEQIDASGTGTRTPREFETFVASDGHLGIRRVAPR